MPSGFPRKTLLETVWKIRMRSTLWSHESADQGERDSFCRFALPKIRDPDPFSYFPNSFSSPTASVRLFRRRSRQVLFFQRPEETRPETLLYPQLVAPVGGLPLAILLRHLSPRRSGPRHPQNAT